MEIFYFRYDKVHDVSYSVTVIPKCCDWCPLSIKDKMPGIMTQNFTVYRQALHVLKSTVNGTSGNLDLIKVITYRKEILDQEVQQTTTLPLDSKNNF